MGGAIESFTTTHWTELREMGSMDHVRRKLMTDFLIGRYWKPVYCYLRHKGFANDSAKDMTQDFFCEIVLEKGLFSRADQAKGRFRTFLLTALDHYVIDTHRIRSAQKRKPRGDVKSLDHIDEMPDLPADRIQASPDQVFCYAWASSLLDDVLATVESECRGAGKITHWWVFRDRVLGPIMEDSDATSMAEICQKYGIERESQASNMIVTVKRRFKAALADRLRMHVSTEAEVGDELSDLLEILSDSGAR